MNVSFPVSVAALGASIIGASAIAGGVPTPPRYTIVELGPVPEQVTATSTASYGLNDLGECTGTSNGTTVLGTDTQAVTLWLQRGAYGLPAGVHELSDPTLDLTRSSDINNSGLVCGNLAPPPTEEGYSRAFSWDPNTGVVTNLGYLGTHQWGQAHSSAEAMNDLGEIVGYSSVAPYGTHARPFWHGFLWDGTQMTMLETFSGDYGRALDINNNGQICGFATIDDPTAPIWDPLVGEELHAALWLRKPAFGLPAGIHDLTPDVTNRPATAEALNDKGQVVMWYPENWPGLGVNNLGVWLPAPAYGLPAGLTEIGGFQGSTGRSTNAHDINNDGLVVGQYDRDPGGLIPDWRGFMYDMNAGAWYDLGARLVPEVQAEWVIVRAMEINSRGEITGHALHLDVQTQVWRTVGYLMTPCQSPEGDADGNGVVDVNDIAYVIFRLGATVPGDAGADVDRNGIVDINDISFVIFRMGNVGC